VEPDAAAAPELAAPEPAVLAPAVPAPRGRRGSLVGDAFGLLKQALGRMGGEQPVTAETVREAMNELAPEGTKQVEPRSMPKLLRQAHDAELIDLTKDETGDYAVRVRREEATPERKAPPPVEEEEVEPPMPASSAPPPPYSQPGTTPGGVPMRSARFRRGSRGGPRPPAPGVPKVGVVEVDPNIRSHIELVPPRLPQPSAGEPVGGREEGERPRRERGERGGRGRGGRGRGGRGGPREGGEARGGGESGERGSRGRRGGRGRGGRSDHSSEERSEPIVQRQVPPARLAEPAAPPPSAPSQPDEGGSFWNRVKRGLIGGE